MTYNVLRVMQVLYDEMDGEHYGASLSEATGISNGTLYPILGRLEDAGLISGEWEPNPQGRRRRFIYRLSGSGIRLYEEKRATFTQRGNAYA